MDKQDLSPCRYFWTMIPSHVIFSLPLHIQENSQIFNWKLVYIVLIFLLKLRMLHSCILATSFLLNWLRRKGTELEEGTLSCQTQKDEPCFLIECIHRNWLLKGFSYSLGISECADQTINLWVMIMPEKLSLESSKNNNSVSKV